MPSTVASPESSGTWESYESSDGTGICCRRIGAGPPVVMVHGCGGGAHSWQPMPDTLGRLATALPDVTVTEFPGQTHFAPSLVPDAVAARIARFLPCG